MTPNILRIMIAVPVFCAVLLLGATAIAQEAKTSAANVDHMSSAPIKLDWRELAPENGRPFNDPFAKLTNAQRGDLSYVARIRRLISQQKLDADGDDAKEAVRLTARLRQQEIDVNWLLVQRQRIPEIRKLQIDSVAKSVAASLKSKSVELVGFATTIPTGRERGTTFLLFPNPDTCGHSVSPSPLHIALVETDERLVFTSPNTPVRVKGVVIAEPKSTPLVRSGGVQAFDSAYKIIGSSIEVLTPTSVRRIVADQVPSSTR
ncbi:DUF3299 domain-containing protein [Planctomycetaceae bacterium SH139]